MRYRKRIIWIICVVMIIATAMTCPVLAAESEGGSNAGDISAGASDRRRAEKVIKVGYYEADNFQEGAADDEIKSGYSYEVLQQISKYTGWRYDYVYGDWPTLYDKFLKGEIDLMPGLSKTEERESQMEFPDYRMQVEYNSIFVRADVKGIDAGDLRSLSGKRIGVIRDNKMTDDLIAWAEENNVTPVLRY